MYQDIFSLHGMIIKRPLLYFLALLFLSGCGSTESSDGSSPSNLLSDDGPKVTLAVNSAKVELNESISLSWESENVITCVAAGNWSGSKQTDGSQVVNGLISNSTFSILCSGVDGSASASVDVVVGDSIPGAPTLSLTASPSSLPYNGSTTLTWIGTNIDNCTAAGGWSGSKNGSGSQTINGLSSNTSFSLSCNGSAGGVVTDQVDIIVSPPIAGLTVDLSASPLNVAQGGSTQLTWTTENADSCVASGDWSGNKNLSGNNSLSNLISDKTYTLTCTGAGGTESDSVTITVADPPPTLSFTASPESVAQNGSTTLSWDSPGATGCVASGDWSGNKARAGSQTLSGLMIDRQFNLVCSGSGGSVNGTVDVTVVLSANGTALMSWTPPTENTDGSALNDLSGYRIHYGTSPGNYSDTIDIDNPGLSSYLIENLTSSAWYFSITAINASGTESGFAPEVSKTIN
jgi:hypothetical protein